MFGVDECLETIRAVGEDLVFKKRDPHPRRPIHRVTNVINFDAQVFQTLPYPIQEVSYSGILTPTLGDMQPKSIIAWFYHDILLFAAMLVRPQTGCFQFKQGLKSPRSSLQIPDADADVLQAKNTRDTGWCIVFPSSRRSLDYLNGDTAEVFTGHSETRAEGSLCQVIVIHRNPPLAN
jgi:hypothetical protein